MILTLAMFGCSSERQPQPATNPPAPIAPPPPSAEEPQPEQQPRQPIPIEVPKVLKELAPQPTAVPEVKFSEALQATCKIKVGDPLPEGKLSTADGQTVSITDLRGEAATVVFFWTAGETDTSKKIASSALADIQADAVAAYGGSAVKAVAINEKDSAQKIAEVLAQAKIDFPVLVDPDGTYFAKVATEQLPRIYVLDRGGKIVWFDLKYSETTRRMLKEVLQVIAGQAKPPAPPAAG